MAAGALAKLLPHCCSVQLIESAEIGIVGVGEATLPHLRAFIETLGLDEAAFMAATHATFKLGIEFRDFGKIGDSYLHPFGDFGRPLNGIPFFQYWLRMCAASGDDLFAYSPCNVMAAANRFARPSADPGSPFAHISYAYQFDATQFAPYLRDHAQALGATRTEGRIVAVERDPLSGDVAAVILADGSRVEGDLFVDCSGFRSLLLGDTLDEPWEDWSQWLPCDRAVAAPCVAATETIEPFTRATAMSAGWRWRIPLQHRVGNGYVYASAQLSDDDATAALLRAIEGPALADPRILRFRAGRRRRSWVGNVVAVGLASGFLEPLESTSIYLAQAAIMELIALFPLDQIEAADRTVFNAAVDYEYDRIRDFLILHYHATTRDDSPFWNHVRTMTVPDSLHAKLELFRAAGRVARYDRGLFFEPSWISVLIGQGIFPTGWDQRVDTVDENALSAAMTRLRTRIADEVAAMPYHASVLAQHG